MYTYPFSGEINTELMICIDDLISRELYKSTGPRIDPNQPDSVDEKEGYDYDIYDDGNVAADNKKSNHASYLLQQQHKRKLTAEGMNSTSTEMSDHDRIFFFIIVIIVFFFFFLICSRTGRWLCRERRAHY